MTACARTAWSCTARSRICATPSPTAARRRRPWRTSRWPPTAPVTRRRSIRRERSAARAVGGAAAGGVLVEALAEVQALQHELDGGGDRGGRLVAGGEPCHGRAHRRDLLDEAGLVDGGDVLAGVGDGALVERGD